MEHSKCEDMANKLLYADPKIKFLVEGQLVKNGGSAVTVLLVNVSGIPIVTLRFKAPLLVGS